MMPEDLALDAVKQTILTMAFLTGTVVSIPSTPTGEEYIQENYWRNQVLGGALVPLRGL